MVEIDERLIPRNREIRQNPAYRSATEFRPDSLTGDETIIRDSRNLLSLIIFFLNTMLKKIVSECLTRWRR